MTSELSRALASGHAAIVATDTVYGLAARPGTSGYSAIFDLKGRPMGQVLPWLVHDDASLDMLATDVPGYARRLARMFWPGPLTLVLRASDAARALGEVAADGTVALRSPDDASLLALLEELDGPLACTSANLHGQPAARRCAELPAAMLELPGGTMLPETCGAGRASTIVDCTGGYPSVLREGPIPGQVLLDVACFGATLSNHD